MKNQKGVKKAKFEEKILNELNLILRQELSDTRLQFASLTKVELSNDFSEALVYWDTFDSSKKDEIAKAFKSAENKLRATLSQVLRVRHTPDIKLKYDTQYESEQYISEILGAEAKKLNDGDS
jgi:ribosome-binding factor A